MTEWQCKNCGSTDPILAYICSGSLHYAKCKASYCATSEQNGIPYAVMLVMVNEGCHARGIGNCSDTDTLYVDHLHDCTNTCPLAFNRGTRGKGPCKEPICIRGLLCPRHNRIDALRDSIEFVDIPNTLQSIIAGTPKLIYEIHDY